jgi:YD repeat-containing protein
MRRALFFLLFLSFSALAQQHPNIERGLLPEKAYEVSDVDNVNLFNGTVNAAIPLGQSYQVGGRLSYRFTLAYATNTWEVGEHIVAEYIPPEQREGGERYEYHTYLWSYPQRHMNAGLGWILTLGKITADFGEPFRYLSPDGGQHTFNNDYVNPSASPSVVAYTADNTYLRLRKYADRYEIDFPTGEIHKFDTTGRLTEMRDPYGNTVGVVYGTRGSGTYASSSQWTISDSAGRTHYVRFRPGPVYEEEHYNSTVSHEIVDSVELAAFGGSRATYQLAYESDGLPTFDAPPTIPVLRAEIPHGGHATEEPSIPAHVRTSVLKSVTMPESLHYDFTYFLDGAQPSPYEGMDAQGNLATMRLPTGASVQYRYTRYRYPTQDNDFRFGSQRAPGIAERKVLDRDGTTILGNTTYTPEDGDDNGMLPATYQLRHVRYFNGGEIVRLVRHHFTTCVLSCGNYGEYGLPLSRHGMPAGGPFLSTETLTPNASGDLILRQSSYVRYEGDVSLTPTQVPSTLDVNRRQKYSKTVHEDGGYVESSSSDYDNYGHYRTTVTQSNISDGDVARTEYVNYNLSATGGNIPRPPASGAWRFDLFTKRSVTEGSVTHTQQFCRDTTGFITSTRRYALPGANPALSPTDLVTIFAHDGLGNVTTEQYLGGDTPTLPDGSSGVPAPTSSACVASSSTDTYRTKTTYSAGSLATSYPLTANGAAMGHFTADMGIDTSTGLTATTRRFSTPAWNGASSGDGLAWSTEYDALGRIKVEQPVAIPGKSRGASRRFVWAADNARVDIYEETVPYGTLLRTRKLTLDGLGRVTEESRSLPAGVTASRTWQYDEEGRMTAVTDWALSGQSRAVTQLTYDGLNRPVKQVTPDGSVTTFTYSGASSTSSTVKVRNGGTATELGEIDATTFTAFDRSGRIRRVTEPDGTQTRYTYEIGGNLSHVCAGEVSGGGCTQERIFNYDARGFLTSQQLPELGANGSGTASFQYDARGNVIRKQIGAAGGDFDVWIAYDRAGRVKSVTEGKFTDGVRRILKLFEYGGSNAGDDYRNGQLVRAVRFNWLAGLNVQMVEDHTFAERDGRMSARHTYDWECAGGPAQCNTLGAGTQKRGFNQSVTYDALGNVQTIQQPQCEHAPCAGNSPARTVTNSYDSGWLTGVTWSGAPRSTGIDYHPNGLVKEVRHSNLVKDVMELHPEPARRMSRPYSMTTSNAIDPGTCVSPSFTTQPASQTVTGTTTLTLSAAAIGESGFPITYTWFRGTAPDTSIEIGTGASIPVTVSTTTQFWVRATNACPDSFAASETATITVCTPPSISSQSASKTITRGQTWPLQVSATGSAVLRYQWYTVVGTTASAINGEVSSSMDVSPTTTTSYRVVVTNDCGTATSTTIKITVANPPTVPANVKANSNGVQNTITWNASSSTVGVKRYEVRRLNGTTTNITMPAALTHSESRPAFTADIYAVRAVDQNNIASAWSVSDLTVMMTFTDPTIAPTMLIRGIHVGELRRAIDAVRTRAGLPPAWSSYAAATGFVLASDFTSMRANLNEARRTLGLTEVVFPETLTPHLTPIRAVHVTELRLGVQ